ncbi:MAG TPA: hypothetical protein HPP80_04415 [Rhodospirillaceae bacterium]|nr:hypothetical protein [Rhodospirillaceae bacterium]
MIAKGCAFWLPALCLGLAACASPDRWTAADRSAVEQRADLSACRREADRQIGRTSYFEPGSERSSDPMKMVDSMEAGRRFDALVSGCMEDLGYRRIQ